MFNNNHTSIAYSWQNVYCWYLLNVEPPYGEMGKYSNTNFC